MLLGDFGFANNKGSHILGYLVPGDITTSVQVAGFTTGSGIAWRMNVCCGNHDRSQRSFTRLRDARRLAADKWIAHLHREAETLLPPPFRLAVEATVNLRPSDPRSRFRPHGGWACRHYRRRRGHPEAPHRSERLQGGRKCLALADALQAFSDDIPAALRVGSPNQVALGKYLLVQGSQTGDYLLFHRPLITKSG